MNLGSGQPDSNLINNQLISALSRKEENKLCADCQKYEVKWINLIFGVFLCLECANYHYNVFTHTHGKIKSIQINNFTDNDVNILKNGGNYKFNNYLQYYGINPRQVNIKEKYLYKCVAYYVKKLFKAAHEFKYNQNNMSKDNYNINFNNLELNIDNNDNITKRSLNFDNDKEKPSTEKGRERIDIEKLTKPRCFGDKFTEFFVDLLGIKYEEEKKADCAMNGDIKQVKIFNDIVGKGKFNLKVKDEKLVNEIKINESNNKQEEGNYILDKGIQREYDIQSDHFKESIIKEKL